MMKWYGMSVGYETKWFRTWKERMRAKVEYRQRVVTRLMVKECVAVIILGMAWGQLIRVIVE